MLLKAPAQLLGTAIFFFKSKYEKSRVRTSQRQYREAMELTVIHGLMIRES